MSFNYEKSEYKNSVFISNHIVNIPCHYRLKDRDLKLITNLIDKFSNEHRNQNINLENIIT